ncbi:MAG: hypothetical protein HY315_05160 [Acidobacteria bacterium]|nr:hypothetical protein [Acidobacteriota bacterium]
MAEHLLKIVDGDPAEVVQRLKEKGARVLHRFGDTLVVEGAPAPEITAEVLRFTRAVAVEPLVEAPAEASDAEVAWLAFRLRQTEHFRRSKMERVTEGEDWGLIFERM